MDERIFYVYILANWNNKVIYTGVTNDLQRRMYEHINHLVDGFTARYNVTKLVYFEEFPCPELAIAREKEIKGWKREKKNQLVETKNPNWIELNIGV